MLKVQNAVLYAYFEDITNPRMEGKISPKPTGIVMMDISAVLRGAESQQSP